MPRIVSAVKRAVESEFVENENIVEITSLHTRLSEIDERSIELELERLVEVGQLIEWVDDQLLRFGWTPPLLQLFGPRIDNWRAQGWRPNVSLTPEQLEDVLLSLDSLGMSELLLDVLRAHPRYTSVESAWSSEYDLQALDSASGQRIYVEVKRVEVLGKSRVDELLEVGEIIRSLDPNGQFVVAAAGVFTSEARTALSRAGIDTWDRGLLYEIADPVVVVAYRAALRRQARDDRDVGEQLLAALRSMPCGKSHWSEYQNLVKNILEYLFVPPLGVPRYERSTATGADRRDIIFANPASDGTWALFRQLYKADFVVVDAKNYKGPIAKPQIISVAHYLKWYGTGLFALIASRRGAARGGQLAAKEQWIGSNRMIVILCDDDFEEMIRLKKERADPASVLADRIESFRLDL